MRVVVALAVVASCAPRAASPHATRPPRVETTRPHEDDAEWVDLDTMSVDLRTGRVRGRTAQPSDDALVDGRLSVVTTRRGTNVRDVEQRNAGYTLHESVRWLGGYTWSSGDMLVSSDKRLARIELSAAPRPPGWIVWELPPLEGTLGTATLLHAYIAFAGYEPAGDGRIALAVVDALGDTGWRETLETMPCSLREVRILDGSPRELTVVVACPEGATIERRDYLDKLQPLQPKRQ